ncbi:MAG TPA: M20/M25/M40 family metallo-hydrolase [Verrucomicrobiae bacterium]
MGSVYSFWNSGYAAGIYEPMRALVFMLGGLALLPLRNSAAPVPAGEPPPRAIRPALGTINAGELLRNIKVLASEDFEGRAPASRGEEQTINWLTEQFRALGLRPGNPDGSWVQEVPLVGITAENRAAGFKVAGSELVPKMPEDCVVWSKRLVPEVSVQDSEVVFAGYGVEAPEYGWDDFKGAELRGKTILVLINDPQVPDPIDAGRLDASMFKGRAMTYYGRWTYKFEEAARKGAAAAIIVHEQALAGYPWGVVVDSNSKENFDLQAPDKNLSRTAIEGWLTEEWAGKLCAAAGFDFQTLKQRATSKDLKPIPLGLKASFSVKNKIRQATSRNFVARLEGSSGRLREQQVIYTAHWDHLGRDAGLPGDPVYHGAVDNASGVAGLIELARAFRKLSLPPKRSILFLSVTAEEKGLLGSRYYAAHPPYPLANTVADLNMDGLNVWGRTADVQVIGAGNSTLEDLLGRAAAAQGRVLEPEDTPERGYFFRSDHFEFVKVGVPALYFKSGTNYLGKPPDFGVRKAEEFVTRSYHKPGDNVQPDWDLSGAVEDLRLLFQVGWNVAQSSVRPMWKPGSEFKANAPIPRSP